MTLTEKNRLDSALDVFIRLCTKTDCGHCPITLFFNCWETCPVEVLAKVLNEAEYPERSFLTCKHALQGETMGVEYCEVKKAYEPQCNCPTCEDYKPREETK